MLSETTDELRIGWRVLDGTAHDLPRLSHAGTFSFWRIHGSALQTRPLNVRQKVTHDDINKFQKLIESYAVIHIRARVISDSVFGRPKALLDTFIGLDDSDSELEDPSCVG
jgi:hypothetical protein